jgi:fused signal recognition particle receptor
MFGFLKDKLKKAISKFTGDVKEEVAEKVEKVPEIKKTDDSKNKIIRETKEKKKQEIKIIEKKIEKPQAKEERKKEVVNEEKPKQKETRHEEKIHKEEKIVHKKEEPKIIHHVKEIKKEEVKEHKKEVHSHKEKVELESKEEEPKKTGFFGKLKQTFQAKPEQKTVETKKIEEEKRVEEIKEEKRAEKEEPVEEKKGFFEKLTEVVTKKTLSESKFDELFFELEIALLENNVALEVIEKIKSDLKKTLLSEKVSRVKTEIVIAESLKKSIDELFDVEGIDLLKEARKKKPYVICFIGVNGSGKTTNLAKVANYLQKKGFSVVIAACDTFRAAAIQQIEEHADRLNIRLIKHDYGADAAAVAYDAIEHAKAKSKDIVLIDTAGRSHSNANLMEELQKVVRVSKPDLKIFVGDSLTGNDAVEQAKTFNEKIGIDGIILSKVDVDEKGGAAISVSYVTKKPILFIGTGQTYDDLEEFEKSKIIRNLGF